MIVTIVKWRWWTIIDGDPDEKARLKQTHALWMQKGDLIYSLFISWFEPQTGDKIVSDDRDDNGDDEPDDKARLRKHVSEKEAKASSPAGPRFAKWELGPVERPTHCKLARHSFHTRATPQTAPQMCKTQKFCSQMGLNVHFVNTDDQMDHDKLSKKASKQRSSWPQTLTLHLPPFPRLS